MEGASHIEMSLIQEEDYDEEEVFKEMPLNAPKIDQPSSVVLSLNYVPGKNKSEENW